MKVKVVSFALKNGSAPGTKSKKLKESNKKLNFNKGKLLNDKRKFLNDKNMSEAKKISLRMQLENDKNKINSFNKSENLFKPKDWSNDPMMKTVKQLGRFDEGLDESSDDDDDESEGNKIEKSSKYFSDGHSIIKKSKMTLGETIRESKIKKATKQLENENTRNILKHSNETFRDNIRHVQSKLGALFKAKANKESEKKIDEAINRKFEEHFLMMEMSEKPNKVENNEKVLNNNNNVKLINNKVDKLHEKLRSAGIINDGENEVNVSDLESEGENEESDNIDEDEESNYESSNDGSEDEDDSQNESDSQEFKITVPETLQITEKTSEIDNMDKLKSLVTEVKSKKRKLNHEEEDLSSKKQKIENNKSELDCLRVLLQMDDLKRDIMLVMASKFDSCDMGMELVVKKVIVATLFQEMLKNNKPFSYSPELLRFVKTVFLKAAEISDHWLSVKNDVSKLTQSQILNICNNEREDVSRLAISTIFHTVKVLKSAVLNNKKLPNKVSIFPPLKCVLEGLPSSLYPSWLRDDINILMKHLDCVDKDIEDIMRVKKQFKIVELMEPDIDDKFASKKDVTKNLKKKVKNERKALKKDVKLDAKSKVIMAIEESRKNSAIRNQKTLAILNNLHQI